MKCPLNVNMDMRKPLSIGFVTLLLMSMAMSVTATPWDGVADNPTPAQAIWIDPKNTTGLAVGDVFTVDILINITDPDPINSPPDGLRGFQYKLYWNSTVLEAVEIQTHTDNIPPGDLLPGWTAVYAYPNETDTAPDGRLYHVYAVAATGSGNFFVGVASICTYKFKVLWQPEESEPDYKGTLDIGPSGVDTILVDDTATEIPHTAVDGEYWVLAKKKPVAEFTWSPFPTPKVGELVTFDASASTPDGGGIISWDWDFNDTTTGTGEIVTHTYTAAGTYNVTLTVTDDEGLTNSTTKSVTIAKGISTITISASPPTIEIGEDTTISGSITPVRVGVTVTIYWRLAGGTWAPLMSVITTSTGGYSYAWTISALGTYEVKASWPGDANYLGDESSIITVTVTKISSSISISASPETIKVGEDTTISGSITPARAGVTVTIHYRLTGGTWNTTTVTTDSTGGYSYTWTPGEAGEYEVKASSPEDANYLAAESSIIKVTVKKAAAPLPYLVIAAILIVIIIIAAGIAIYFLKIRKS